MSEGGPAHPPGPPSPFLPLAQITLPQTIPGQTNSIRAMMAASPRRTPTFRMRV